MMPIVSYTVAPADEQPLQKSSPAYLLLKPQPTRTMVLFCSMCYSGGARCIKPHAQPVKAALSAADLCFVRMAFKTCVLKVIIQPSDKHAVTTNAVRAEKESHPYSGHNKYPPDDWVGSTYHKKDPPTVSRNMDTSTLQGQQVLYFQCHPLHHQGINSRPQNDICPVFQSV
ncbi:TPA: hypothetical protein MYR83_004051 [Escherichia coli]|nr:hypothetical protein [Escherichia coli]